MRPALQRAGAASGSNHLDRRIVARPASILRMVLLTTGLYYLVTGVWPLLHRASFERVTGRKRDFWLAQTVGALIAVIGGLMTVTALRRDVSRDVIALALGTASSLGALELYHSLRGRIAPVYGADALLEALIVAGIVSGLRRERHERRG